MQVYGHLVAADVFGDGYVVPLLDSFNDMKRCLAAENIAIERHYGHTQKLKMGTTDTHKPLGVEPPDGTSDSVDADDVLGIAIGVKKSYVDVPRVKKMQKVSKVLDTANTLLTRAPLGGARIAQSLGRLAASNIN